MNSTTGIEASPGLPTISVIVPVYNAAVHLDQCVSSILAQDHAALEVILVNDGSSDGSGEICDRWAARDARVRVVHQENRGASAARNVGLEVATGAYVGSVDADDWIAPEMFASMYQNLVEADADIALTACVYVYPDGTHVSRYLNAPRMVMNTEQGLTYVNMPGYYGVALWDKLVRAELFDGVRFPEDVKRGEDYAVSFELLTRAKTLVYDSSRMYFYRQLPNSLSNSRRSVGAAPADVTRRIVDLTREKYPGAYPAAVYGHAVAMLGVYSLIISSREVKKWSDFERNGRRFLREHRRTTLRGFPLSWPRRIQFSLFTNAPLLYRVAFRSFKAVHPRRFD